MRFFNFFLLLVFCSGSCSEKQSSDFIIITNEDHNSISVIKSDSLDKVFTFKVGKRPRGIKVAKNRMVYVAVSGSPKSPPWLPREVKDTLKVDKAADGIVQIDPFKRKMIQKFNGGSDPEQFDISMDDSKLFVANEDQASVSVIEIGSKQVIKIIPVGEEPEGVRVSPDGKIVVVTCEDEGLVFFIDSETLEVKGHLKAGSRPRDAVFNSHSSIVYVSSELEGLIYAIDVLSMKIINTIKLPHKSMPVGMVIHPETNLLYVANGRGKNVSEVNLQQSKVTRTVKVTERPWNIALSTDGKTLYTANGPSNDISVIDIKQFKVIKSIKTGKGTWGIAVARR